MNHDLSGRTQQATYRPLGACFDQDTHEPFAGEVRIAFRDFVQSDRFPCVAAKAALNAGVCRLGIYSELGSENGLAIVTSDLRAFVDEQKTLSSDYTTFVAVFRGPVALSERVFEERLWRQLALLHRDDQASGFAWDSRVSADPEDANFSFSFAGEAFYVVGLHAESSRLSRQFRWPTLVFNSHDQFQRVRAAGRWERMQKTIRKRDQELQGDTNPMIGDFGTESEARQYSGRAVEADWRPSFRAEETPLRSAGKCPFGHG